MNLPRLKIRPLSQQSCARFGGVYHNPAAPVGTWYDERNLCSDMYPNAVARRGRTMVQNIDGNTPTVPIVAMCGGDHVVLLDETSTFWCNGYSQEVPFYNEDEKCLRWYWGVDKSHAGGNVHVTISPEEGSDTTFDAFNGLGVSGDTVTKPVIRFKCTETDTGVRSWQHDDGTNGVLWFACDLRDYNIVIDGDNNMDNVVVILNQLVSYTGLLKEGHSLLRMGALVIEPKGKVWVNAVKLASGSAMVEGEDYGYLEATAYSVAGGVTMSLCDIDGNPYSGVVVSSSEPAQQGYWLDTGGPTPVLREWNYLSAAWIKISSTFVRISMMAWDEGYPAIKKGDTVHVSQEDGGSDAQQLLQGAHYLYNVIDNGNDTVDVVISGILSSDQVSDPDVSILMERNVPDMDFVVECGNRLWGCRYDEANSINEIYASKLGDPTNWEVYQGLSTDSWRASRGVAAPFTGAAVLDGHPLFFREASLEKVYPSASGAHQIQTFDLEGVEQGVANSLCVIEDRLYYKSPKGIMVYTGSLPRRISDALGDLEFTGGSGARHQRKYCLSTRKTDSSPSAQNDDGEDVVLVYDLYTGDWHIETDAWTGKAITWKDDLYYIYQGSIASMAKGPGYGRVQWWAETAPQAIHDESAARSLTAHKWISYFRLRFRFLSNGTPRMTSELRVYFSYEDGPWELKKRYVHSGADGNLKTFEIAFLPKRKDNFRLRLEGQGPCQIYDIAWRMEKSEAGH